MRDPRVTPAPGDIIERMVGARRCRRTVTRVGGPWGGATTVAYTSAAGTGLACGLGQWRTWAKLADVVFAAGEDR